MGTGGSSPGRKAAEVKNAWNCTSTPTYIFMAWCSVKYKIRLHVLVKPRDNFTFSLLFRDLFLVIIYTNID